MNLFNNNSEVLQTATLANFYQTKNQICYK